MKKSLFVLLALVAILALALTACGGNETPAPEQPAEEAPAEEAPAEEAPAEEAPAEETPAEEAPAEGEKVQIRWFVGLGTGTDPEQVTIEEALVEAFNASHDNIELVLEVIPYESSYDTLATEIASGEGPDIIGPVGWGGSNAFYGQWLDLTPLVESTNYDLGQFDPALVEMYQTEEGLVGLPFAVFPAAVFYNTTLFDEAGLNYLPAEYGEKYTMPDGTEVEWDWDALTEVARILTVDINGNDATSPDFDATQVVQYGYHPIWSGHPNYLGAFYGAAALYEGEAGNYTAVIPDHWKVAWDWWYNGIWGDQPFIPNGAVAESPEYGSSNTFASGKIGMGITNLWYTCCLDEFADAGYEFQFGILPSYNGEVHGRVDADTFRIWKGTQHPEEAFEVLTYLIGPEGVEPLIVGDGETPGAYGAFPALPEYQQAFIDSKSAQYPFVTTWDTIIAGNAYPDVPSAEGYMPNWNEAWDRIGTFGDLMNNTEDLDLEAEIQTLQDDLTTIFNK